MLLNVNTKRVRIVNVQYTKTVLIVYLHTIIISSDLTHHYYCFLYGTEAILQYFITFYIDKSITILCSRFSLLTFFCMLSQACLSVSVQFFIDSFRVFFIAMLKSFLNTAAAMPTANSIMKIINNATANYINYF